MNSEVDRRREDAVLVQSALREALARELELSKRIQAYAEHVSVLGHDVRHYRDQCSNSEVSLQAASLRERELSERLNAYAEQLTAAGNDARHFRDAYSTAQVDMRDVSARESYLSERLQEIFLSRSWRWTRWLRAGTRYLRTGRFNSSGTVGLFGALQAAGRRLPVPQYWRSLLGRVLTRFRRH